MSIRPDQIPQEAVEAVARALCVGYCSQYEADPEIMWRYFTEEANAIIAAALAAWPDKTIVHEQVKDIISHVILPLQEPSE